MKFVVAMLASVTLLGSGLALIACGDGSDARDGGEPHPLPTTSQSASTILATTSEIPAAPTDAEALACRVSDQRSRPLPAALGDAWGPDWQGRGDLYAAIQSRTYTGDRLDDGRIGFKLGWWRRRTKHLRLSARRLDGAGTAEFATMESAYGTPGILPAGVTFSQPGCWQVTGRLGNDRVVVTVLVR